MGIEEAYRLVHFIAKRDRGGYITPSQFNMLAKSAQWDLCDRIYNEGYPLNTTNKDKLMPLLVTRNIQVFNGIINRPSNFWHLDSVTVKLFVNGGNEMFVQAKELDNNQYKARLSSRLVPADIMYPIVTQLSDQIRIAPLEVKHVTFDYLRVPKNPYFDFDIVNDAVAYKASGQDITVNAEFNGLPATLPRKSQSQDFELPENCHNTLILMILEKAGIGIDDDKLVQYSNAKMKEGA